MPQVLFIAGLSLDLGGSPGRRVFSREEFEIIPDVSRGQNVRVKSEANGPVSVQCQEKRKGRTSGPRSARCGTCYSHRAIRSR